MTTIDGMGHGVGGMPSGIGEEYFGSRGLGAGGEEWRPSYEVTKLNVSQYKEIKNYLNGDKELEKINKRKHSVYFLENNSPEKPGVLLMEVSHGGPFGIIAINKDFQKIEKVKKDLGELLKK